MLPCFSVIKYKFKSILYSGLAEPPNATLFTMYTSIESDYIQYHKTPIDIQDASVHITIHPQSPDDVYQVCTIIVLLLSLNYHSFYITCILSLVFIDSA